MEKTLEIRLGGWCTGNFGCMEGTPGQIIAIQGGRATVQALGEPVPYEEAIAALIPIVYPYPNQTRTTVGNGL